MPDIRRSTTLVLTIREDRAAPTARASEKRAGAVS